MKESQPNFDPHDLQGDRNDPLWQLLGESPRPEPDAWFTVRTLARCREVKRAAEARAFYSLSGMWRWALGGGLSVCLALFLMVPRAPFSHSEPVGNQQSVQEAFTIMASIQTSDSDSDSSTSTSSSWQDSSTL
jgi:hypothetical protein